MRLELEELTEKIIGAAIEVHRALGPGPTPPKQMLRLRRLDLLESAYQECLCHELSLRRLDFQRQQSLPVAYKGIKLDCGYRLDIVVEGKVVVELKCVEQLLPVHRAQLLTYLRLGGYKVGLLFNFNVAVLKDGLERMVL